VQSAQALAWLNGRDFIVPDDLLELAGDVLRHRLILSPKALVSGLSRDAIITRLCAEIPLP
jgi:MoxR-like ATPase